jgi:glycosyltransferase involved in cell wall biosynthesis
MRISIDARLNAYRQGGISQYTRQLLTALAEVSQEDEFISLQHRDQLRPLAIAPNVIRRTALTPPHHRLEQWTLPLEVLLARPNVLHCPDFIAPVRRPCPAVVTIHDLAFMHYPEILDEAASAYYGQVRTNAPRADAIIAVSEATRQDIAQFLDIPIEQIDVIYEAAAPLYTRLELRQGEARVLNSTPVEADTFMLFVSTLEPRKNLPTLLRALRICIDRKPDAGYRLVVVGRRGWRDEAIFETVRDLKLGEHVLFAGGVGQYDLRWLYNACRLYINPSLYEGFGLPLLEAMACGAPCLAAATSSLPEIGGKAAIYVPPLDADVWADEIAALWDDAERRAELGRMGMARAQRFSWLRAARETLEVYKRAAERIVPAPAPRPAPLHETFADLAADDLAESPASRRAIPAPGGPRTCLRCGADMVPGKLQHQLGMRAGAGEDAEQVLAPRMWACARCGHVELAVDWAVAAPPQPEATPEAAGALEEAPIYAPEPPAVDAPALLNGHASEHDAFEQATTIVSGRSESQSPESECAPEGADQALAPEVEETPAPPDDVAVAADTAADQAPPPELEHQPAEAIPVEPAAEGADVAASEAVELAPAASVGVESDEAVAPAPELGATPPPMAPAAGADAPSLPQPIAEVAVGEAAGVEAVPNGKHSAEAAGVAPVSKPKSRSRRSAPAAGPAEPTPPKRRQSRSKRK